MYMYVDQFILF